MATSNPVMGEKARLPSAVLLLPAALSGTLALSTLTSPGGTGAPRFDGEYGLYVREVADTVEVRWLTVERDSGFLDVSAEGAVRARFTTPTGRAHRVSFRRPAPGSLTLHYGALGDPVDRHATTIFPSPERGETRFGPTDSVFVIGDVHGEYDSLTALLRNVGLIGANGRWTGGRGHLVFLGDLFDRGPDVTRTLWFIYGLERQAEAVGGRVHVVLGNHEIMVLAGDLRYVSSKERCIAEYHGTTYPRLFNVRNSVLGKWLATKPALIRIGRILLAHGGVSTKYLDYSLQAVDDTLATFMGEELFHRWGQPPDSTLPPIVMDSTALAGRIDFFFGESSVFWYRDYVLADTLQAELARVLDRFDSDLHVVAHTMVENVQERYGGSLVAVDLNAPASQLLLLVDDGLQRLRYGTEGSAECLRPPPAAGGEAGGR